MGLLFSIIPSILLSSNCIVVKRFLAFALVSELDTVLELSMG